MNMESEITGFLHRHPLFETERDIGPTHVVVDKEHWIRAREIIQKTQIAPPVITTQLHDLPATDSTLVAYRTALSLWSDFCNDKEAKSNYQTFPVWCNKQLIMLAGE